MIFRPFDCWYSSDFGGFDLAVDCGDPAGKLHIPNRKYIGLQALTGLLTITGGNGFVTWAMQYVSSGLSAVIGSMTPVMVLIINYFWHSRGERFHPLTAIGVITGFGGLGFIFYEGWAD